MWKKYLLRFVAVVFGLILAFFVVWQAYPPLVLGTFNKVVGKSLFKDGDVIIARQAAEYKDPAGPPPLCFRHTVIDSGYHSEGAGVGDMSGDGRSDIIIGDFWYEAPTWVKHAVRGSAYPAITMIRPLDFVRHAMASADEPESRSVFDRVYPRSFFAFPEDMDGDERLDMLAVDLTRDGVSWYKNDGAASSLWGETTVYSQAAGETPVFHDILGTGKKQLLVGAVSTETRAQQLTLIEFTKDGSHIVHPVRAEGTQPKGIVPPHGLGVGDINQDGLIDIVVGPGLRFDNGKIVHEDDGAWYEHILVDGKHSWKAHTIANFPAPSDIHIQDLNADGRPDIVFGSAHDFGLFWFEQGDHGEWKPHLIDASYSQLHAVSMADIDGDGLDDIITGKTRLAHFGILDRDEFGPALLYWYQQQKDETGSSYFIRHLIDDSVGIGRQVSVSDVDGDGLADIALANRNGVHLFTQQAHTAATECSL